MPDRRPRRPRHLAEGVLAEGSVVGRLFGLRLLRLDVSVLLTPASTAPVTVEVPVRLDPGPPLERPVGRLAEAVRYLDEGRASLDAAATANGRT